MHDVHVILCAGAAALALTASLFGGIARDTRGARVERPAMLVYPRSGPAPVWVAMSRWTGPAWADAMPADDLGIPRLVVTARELRHGA